MTDQLTTYFTQKFNKQVIPNRKENHVEFFVLEEKFELFAVLSYDEIKGIEMYIAFKEIYKSIIKDYSEKIVDAIRLVIKEIPIALKEMNKVDDILKKI